MSERGQSYASTKTDNGECPASDERCKIISGGQTGADRAGRDFAIETGLEHGRYVPKGRKAEDGRIADRYILIELRTSSYPGANQGLEARSEKTGQERRQHEHSSL